MEEITITLTRDEAKTIYWMLKTDAREALKKCSTFDDGSFGRSAWRNVGFKRMRLARKIREQASIDSEIFI